MSKLPISQGTENGKQQPLKNPIFPTVPWLHVPWFHVESENRAQEWTLQNQRAVLALDGVGKEGEGNPLHTPFSPFQFPEQVRKWGPSYPG